MVGILRAHWRELALGCAVAAVGTGIAVNALVWQTARHPAPFFAGKTQDRPQDRAQDKPQEARRPADAPAARTAVAGAGAAPALQGAAQPSASPAPARARDPIGDLIRTGEAPKAAAPKPQERQAQDRSAAERPGPDRTASVAEKPEPTARVALGQKALLKLGYGPLKADGLMGPGTRQAIERFERDHKLPVTGELSGRTLRALAAQSSTTIE
jgi:hypothetical protein